MPLFSVVIAARDAAATLSDTLASLREQTFTDWEALVVDDGSLDETPAIVERAARTDPRIRLLRASSRGVASARNDAIAAAAGTWLLCLDADDTIFPGALDAWQRAIANDPSVDAWCGGWIRVAPGGEAVPGDPHRIATDMFPVFARLSPFPIHSCAVRRALVQHSGGFDAGYVTCEDWDLWQRLARAGARFGAIESEVARYHMRPQSLSLAARQMLADGLRVIATGHAPDPRVPSPVEPYASGMRRDGLAALRFGYACWPAGLLLGSGDDARPVLDAMAGERAPDIDPGLVAGAIVQSALLPRCAAPREWDVLWPAIGSEVERFLTALEARTGARLLARRVVAVLARLIAEHLAERSPLTRVGCTQFAAFDTREHVASLRVADEVERVVVRVRADETVGFLELPACDGTLDAEVIRDAIAHTFGWTMLRDFFARTLNAGGRRDPEWSAGRHDTVGWVVFLQELWGEPDWPNAAFYDPDWPSREAARVVLHEEWVSVDVLDPLADIETTRDVIYAELCIGGAPVCVARVPVEQGVVRASRLRAALTVEAGVELLHVTVREALVGVKYEEGDAGSLRDRLARRRASRTAAAIAPPPFRGAAPSASARLASLEARAGGVDVIAARRIGPPGSAASRRADLPAAARIDVIAAARAADDAFVSASSRSGRVVYAPDLLYDGAQAPIPVADVARPPGHAGFGRHHFESLFAAGSDPWRYTTAYERRKYEQTLSLLPAGPIHRALEIGCAEGHFTEALADRVEGLTAVDISTVALDRAAARCAAAGKTVSFTRLDLAADPLPPGNDLIVCSELLYYLGTADDLRRAAGKLRDALREGGRLVTAHANVASDDPASAGYTWDVPFGAKTIREVLASTPGLQLTRELRTDLYAVMQFERTDEPHSAVVEQATLAMPEAEVAAHIRWPGAEIGVSAPASSPGETLPILMYHRLAASPGEASYTVPAEKFAEQLGYLRDSGFQGVTVAEWIAAIHRRQPLPGRSVAITFDDAYDDFETIALPLLQRHGFGATLFVVTAHVGGWNAWDAGVTDRARLMDWAAIARAATAGIEIGAHSATHPPMTGLAPAEIAREASLARREIAERVQRPVTAFAYPYGDADAVVEHLVGGCGFLGAVTCRFAVSTLRDHPLRLPRIEVGGSDSLGDFIRKLAGR